MRSYVTALLGIAILLFASADTALAGGGGGSKSDPKVQIQNRAGTRIAVLTDATAWLAAGQNPADFVKYGGKFLNNYQLHTFKVKAGNIKVVAALLDNAGNPIGGSEAMAAYNVASRAFLRLKVVQANGKAIIQNQ